MATTSNEAKMETLRKQIAKREETIRTETEKLKSDREKLASLKTAVLSEYIEKEGIDFDENFRQQMELAKKIMTSGVSGEDIEEFFSLSEPEPKPNPAATTMEVKAAQPVQMKMEEEKNAF